ncbi:alpha/beta hydrolase [Ktedonospora formicarum]|uniref:Thioesterase n=1 Tax=Ktedonospora formicarum TaxID=2778364 RepID=A0A8J3I4U6_9CHLR|nr:alpha/beta hydrolase [Ktedonospora formicarum]GHO49514.1 thioesterase [Ktedonospora formicarum]
MSSQRVQDPPQQSLPQTRPKRHIWSYILVMLCLVLVIGGISIAFYIQPYPASDEARAAVHSDGQVNVFEDGDMIAFIPLLQASEGLIFYPGAKVEPAAYAVYMHALATQGYATFIAKMPLNFAILGGNKADNIISLHPEIKTWAIGGHSLGGVIASDYAGSHPNIKGLLFYASYANNDISGRSDFVATSIYGSRDGLSTPAKINAAKAKAPASTQYVAIDGAIHSYFGDYGKQDGDGLPTISHQLARQQIITASILFMQRLAS